MRLRLVINEITARCLRGYGSPNIPKVGILSSQAGNVLFPRWEFSFIRLSQYVKDRASRGRAMLGRSALGTLCSAKNGRCGGRAAARRGGILESGGCLRCCSLFCSFLLLYVDECFVLRGWSTQSRSRAAGGSARLRQPFRRRSRVFRVRGLLHGRCFLSLSMPHGGFVRTTRP